MLRRSRTKGQPVAIRHRLVIGLAFAALVCSACSSSQSANNKDDAEVLGAVVARDDKPSINDQSGPSEFTGAFGSVRTDRAGFAKLGAVLFGGIDGAGEQTNEIDAVLSIRSQPHPDSSTEMMWEVLMDIEGLGEPAERVLARVPVSKATGSVFTKAIDAAFEQYERVLANGDNAELFTLEYRTRSVAGGNVTLAIKVDPKTLAPPLLTLTVNTPELLLDQNDFQSQAYVGEPFDSIYGLVEFGVERDQFDFFVNRAYGLSAGKSQNFYDFRLIPHNWLRLTVTPLLDDNVVDVAFEVVTPDGERIPFAHAPASLRGGEQFKNSVFAMVDQAAAAEKAEPGSALPWKVPFYYDDPNGGGIVEVIAYGDSNGNKIAYAVESPSTTLTEVEPIRYQGIVNVPDDWDAPPPTCVESNSTEAQAGRFMIAFEASSTVRNNELKAPLKGNVYGSVFRAEDVLLTGPIEGSESVANFTFDNVDSVDGPSKEFDLGVDLPAGTYQILGFMDIDANADPADPDPDVGDPVFIPIGGFELKCETQNVVAEFALTLPEGQD